MTPRLHAPTPAEIATLARLTRAQNNFLIPLSNVERDQMAALLRWVQAQPAVREINEEGGS